MTRKLRTGLAGLAGYLRSASPTARAFLRGHGGELVVGLLIALLAYGLTFDLEKRLADRQDRLENLRFVREHAAPELRKPFRSLDLRGATLTGLDLTCAADKSSQRLGKEPQPGQAEAGTDGPFAEDFESPQCADLEQADLTEAEMSFTRLTGADLQEVQAARSSLVGADLASSSLKEADLRDADLSGANLTNATLERARLIGTNLTAADLTRADLRGADLRGATLRRNSGQPIRADLLEVCFDENTRWPSGFKPPTGTSSEACDVSVRSDNDDAKIHDEDD